MPAIVGILALAALFAPLIAPYGPNELDLPFALLSSPSSQHLFGTDDAGRDIFTRVLYGRRLDLACSSSSPTSRCRSRSSPGRSPGYFGGWVDPIVTRLADIMISFPFIVLALAMVTIPGRRRGFLIGVRRRLGAYTPA